MNRNILLLRRPASVEKDMWKTGLPIGNGITGALMLGAISEEKIIVTRHDLWRAKKGYMPLPQISHKLKEMRKLIDKDEYISACNMMHGELCRLGYPVADDNSPFPLGEVKLEYLHNGLLFKHYRRGIDMEKGYAFVRWEDHNGKHERRSFVSRKDGVLYIHIKNENKCSFLVDFDAQDNFDAASAAEKQERANNLEKSVSGRFIKYAANTDGQDFGMLLEVEVYDDGSIDEKYGALVAESCDFAIKIATFAKIGRNEAFEKCKQILKNSESFETALKLHSEIHSAAFNDVSIKLVPDESLWLDKTNEELLEQAYDEVAPTVLYEKLWRFGRYLFVSAMAKGANPFPLYGLWPGTYNLPWNAHVCNENVEMIYLGVFTGGLADSVKSLVDYYFEKMDECKQNAEKLFGCIGIYIPTYTTPATMDGKNLTPPLPTVPVTLNWISGAGWLSLIFCQYFEYTKDLSLLREKILPFMIETARFYEDYTVIDKDGKARLYPSVSPENTPGNFIPENFNEHMGHICPVTENSTMDFAIMKSLLKNLMDLLDLPETENMVSREEKQKWQSKQLFRHI